MKVDPDFYSLLTILIVSVLVLFFIYGKRNLRHQNLLSFGFLLRLFLLFADYYHWFPILHSGSDTEGFHRIALRNAHSLVKYVITNYTVFLTFVYEATDCSRLIAQFINVLLGIGIIVLVQQCMRMLKINKVTELTVVCVLVFLPNLTIFSAILLREAWVEFFVALSLYFFVKWFIYGNALNIVLVVVSMLTASYMHSGVIGLLVGYAIAFIAYNPKIQKATFSKTTVISLILLIVLSVGLSSHLELFTEKFASYDNLDDIVDIANSKGGGGADYLTWINTNSVTQSILLAPLKMFYFLFSPLPTEWRGMKDIVGFLIDGAAYMGLCYSIMKHKAQSKVHAKLKYFLLISLIAVTFIFAYGAKNAGTAIRHRAKIISVVLVIYALGNVEKKMIKEE